MKEELLEKLRSEDKNEVREAIEALEEYPEPEVVRAVLGAVVSKKSKAVLEAGKNFLMNFKGDPKVVCEEVIRLFEYPEPKLRQAAIEVLADRGDLCLNVVREKLVKHEDYNMRKFALDILSAIGSERALEELAPLLQDENPNVSMSALEYLRSFSPFKDRVVELLLQVIPRVKDIYGLTTLASTIIYGEIKDDRLIEPLKKKLEELSDPLEKHWIYKTLVFLGDRSIHEQALENARSVGMEQDIEKDIEIFGSGA
ncbi:HEAT repeat domain-containing protein [Hydrogenivirga sp.]